MEKAGADVQRHIIKQVIAGIIGTAATEQYWAFSDSVVSFEDVLTGKVKGGIKTALERVKNDIERDKLKQKLQIEATAVMKNREFSEKEATNLKTFLVELGSKERATAVLQTLFMLKNQGELSHPWIDALMKGPEVMELIKHLMVQKNV
jgi:hypothetical protein